MIPPSLTVNESERLKSLAEHQLLDTLPEETYDEITRLAAEICGTPIAAINLIAEDRQWSKSTFGKDNLNCSREDSFCGHAILNPDEPLVVEDARYDNRFHDNPHLFTDPKIIFYAGVPVKDASGRPLGSLCVIDSRPRELSEYKLKSLKALANLVNTHFQLRKTRIELEQREKQISNVQPLLQTIMTAIDSIKNNDGDSMLLDSLNASLKELKDVLDNRGREF